MSNRTHLLQFVPVNERGDRRGSTSFPWTNGDAHVSFLRDDDTRTYRLFIQSDLLNVDLTVGELALLRDALTKAIDTHQPFTDDDGKEVQGAGEGDSAHG